jgi:hypothetical protein
MSTEFFSYPNSSMADAAPAAAPAPAAPAPAPSVQPSEPLQFAYPSMQPEAPQAATDVPANIAELRRADDARALFSPQKTYANVVQDFPGESDEIKAFRAEGRNQMADMQLAPDQARDVVSIFDTELQNGIPSDETAAQWAQESMRELQQRFGAEAPARLREAQQLIQRDPRISRMLAATKLGNHPRLVLMAVEAARSQRNAGKL